MPKPLPILLLITLFSFLSAQASFGFSDDTAAMSSAIVSSSASPAVLYHWIRGAAYLSRKADAADKVNGTRADIRNAFSLTIGLNDKDAKAVFAFAIAIDAQFATLDKRARSIIEVAEANAANGGPVPPPPAELLALQQQKTDLINQLASMLALTCSLEGQQAIIKYLQGPNTQQASQSSSQVP